MKKVGRPKKDVRFVHKSFRLPQELSEALDAYVEESTGNASLVIRKAIMQYIARSRETLASPSADAKRKRGAL